MYRLKLCDLCAFVSKEKRQLGRNVIYFTVRRISLLHLFAMFTHLAPLVIYMNGIKRVAFDKRAPLKLIYVARNEET